MYKFIKTGLKFGKVAAAIKIIEVLLISGGCYGVNFVNEQIENHLDYNAIRCGFVNNVMGYFDINIGLPRMQNSDVNGDGCLESILLCNVNCGVKTYQRVELNNDGVESLGPIMTGRF